MSKGETRPQLSDRLRAVRAKREDELRLLIVDGDLEHAEQLASELVDVELVIEVVTSSRDAIRALSDPSIAVVITDTQLPDGHGYELLETAVAQSPPIPVIVLSRKGDTEEAIEAVVRGALTYLAQPVSSRELKAVVTRALERAILQRENERLLDHVEAGELFRHIVASSPAMARVLATMHQAASTNATVLITGETGTGKEIVARSLHDRSGRRSRAFVGLNCAALSESILESELFGHEKGAFTGATAMRKGRFEYAHGGTLFLDEVGDLPMTTQIKLLRVLEEREITRVGSNDPIPVDIRLISATHRDLEAMIEAGDFRRDLYYRLRVIHIHLPPLRERPTDIPLLIEHFLRQAVEVHDKIVHGISPEARRILAAYPWPGNVRELKGCIETMVVVATGPILELRDVPTWIRGEDELPDTPAHLAGRSWEEVEKQLIRETLEMVEGNREEAARLLGMGERTLYRKLKKYDLS